MNLEFLDGSPVRTVKTIDGITQVPRYPVTPTVDGATCGALRATLDDAGVIESARIVLSTGNDVEAANDVAENNAYVTELRPGQEIPVSLMADGSDGNITYLFVDVVGKIGTAPSGICAEDAVINISTGDPVGSIAEFDATQAELIAAPSGTATHHLVPVVFESSDNVRHVVVSMSEVMTDGTDLYCDIKIRGASYGG